MICNPLTPTLSPNGEREPTEFAASLPSMGHELEIEKLGVRPKAN
jgi:hypothetical protein